MGIVASSVCTVRVYCCIKSKRCLIPQDGSSWTLTVRFRVLAIDDSDRVSYGHDYDLHTPRLSQFASSPVIFCLCIVAAT